MTQTEFDSYWKTFFAISSIGDPGSVVVGEGSASFIIGDQKYVGISQSISPGNYLLSLSVSGSLTSTRHFVVYSGEDKLYSFISPGNYSIPLSVLNGNIKLLYSSSAGTDLNNPGILYSIKLEAPQTSYVETIYTVSGTISRPRTDGKERYMGDLNGTRLQVTNGNLLNNPYLTSNYTISSSNPNFNFSTVFYEKDIGSAIPIPTQWVYTTQQINFPTKVKVFYNGVNTQVFYKIDNTIPNYNNLGDYSTTSPSARSFTLLNNGDIISVGNSQYLSFACSASAAILEDVVKTGGISLNEINNPNISLYSFLLRTRVFNSTVA